MEELTKKVIEDCTKAIVPKEVIDFKSIGFPLHDLPVFPSGGIDVGQDHCLHDNLDPNVSHHVVCNCPRCMPRY